ncbi:MAG: deoxyribose-phosphate aldolase [Paludibacteraceae bacterium]|nr:deoxyribose-phosphate aldolase [Paludibacteraceae bacterium]
MDFASFFKAYPFPVSEEEIKLDVKHIIEHHYENNDNFKSRKFIYSALEITSLNATDQEREIRKLVEQINNIDEDNPELPMPAGICVYPSLVEIVRNTLTEDVGITTVIGFPHAQTFPEVKIAEASLSILSGATEIDMVMNVGKFLSGDCTDVYDEISEVKATCKDKTLKVILETGLLKTPENIFKASLLAMEAGADFIKSTTGKTEPTTLAAVYTMCRAIRAYYEKTNIQKGIKVAGGVKTIPDALMYLSVVKEILGEEFLSTDYFRIGASSLEKELRKEISRLG